MSTTETFLGHNGNAPGYRSAMFYQPDKKYTIAVLTNYHGTDAYAIAKALVAALPEFTGGNPNRKEDKIKLCFNGNLITIDRNAADGFIKKGAYLGDCEASDAKRMNPKDLTNNPARNSLEVFPNPSSGQVKFSFVADVAGPISLELHDANGKLVATIFKGNMQKGAIQQVNLEKGKLPAGVYVGTLKTTAGDKQQKIILTN